MNKSIIKPRYQEITTEIIKSIKTEGDLLKQSDLLFEEEHYKLDNAIELTGGKVSRVYKINCDGTSKVLKISTGLYRITELKRESEVLRNLRNYGCEDLVPNIVTFKER